MTIKVILETMSSFRSGVIDFAQNNAPSRWDIELKNYEGILR